MSRHPEPVLPAAGGLNELRVRLAFGADEEHPAQPAVLLNVDGNTLRVGHFDGTTGELWVESSAALDTVLARTDLCRLRGRPLLMVNVYHGVLGVATGPVEAPRRLEVLRVCRLEDGAAVEVLAPSDDQPSWQLLPLVGG